MFSNGFCVLKGVSECWQIYAMVSPLGSILRKISTTQPQYLWSGTTIANASYGDLKSICTKKAELHLTKKVVTYESIWDDLTRLGGLNASLKLQAWKNKNGASQKNQRDY